jgi:Flp pilus assembly protein TadG
MRGRVSLQGERGASAVELGIVMSVLFLFVFGIIQFGLAYNRHQGLQAGAREGARVASVGATEADIRDRVRKAQSLFADADVRIAIDYSTDDGATFPGGNKICDDASSDSCSATTAPSPCGRAGVGNLIRVTATVPGSTGKYAIIIPLWGNHNVTFSSLGIFRCEESN